MNKLSYTIPDFYKEYNKEYPNTIDYKTYRAILIDFFKGLADGLLNKSAKYKLPYGLGTLSVVKKLPQTYTKKSLAIDYKTTRELGKVVYHTNEHSDGYKYKFHWCRIGTPNMLPQYYRLVMVRANKRQLAQIIKNKQTDFPEI